MKKVLAAVIVASAVIAITVLAAATSCQTYCFTDALGNVICNTTCF